jgi:hypothetical protein
MNTTKQRVRKDFSYAREMMREADVLMRSYGKQWDEYDFEKAEEVANELIAAVGSFYAWVEEMKDAHEEAAEEEEYAEPQNPSAIHFGAPSDDPEVIAQRNYEMWVYTR